MERRLAAQGVKVMKTRVTIPQDSGIGRATGTPAGWRAGAL